MPNTGDPWHAVDTPCFPRRFKVSPRHTYRDSNLLDNFFESSIEAQEVSDSRNETHRRRHVDDCKKIWGDSNV